jgi:hypothetical protein
MKTIKKFFMSFKIYSKGLSLGDAEKTILLESYLIGEAAEWFSEFEESMEWERYKTYLNLKTHLINNYTDSQESMSATIKLSNLKM